MANIFSSLNLYTSINGSFSLGNPELLEVGSKARIPVKKEGFLRQKEENERLAKTALKVRIPNRSETFYVEESDLDSVDPNLKTGLKELSPEGVYSELASRMQVLSTKYVRARDQQKGLISGQVDWRASLWSTVVMIKENPIKGYPAPGQAILKKNKAVAGQILTDLKGEKIFQIHLFQLCPSARLPVEKIQKSTIPAENDLVIEDGKNRYLCKESIYKPRLNISKEGNARNACKRIDSLAKGMQTIIVPSILKNLKTIRVLDWQEPFFQVLVNLPKIKCLGEGLSGEKSHHFSSKQMAEVPFGFYVCSASSIYFRIKILLGNGRSKDVKLAFSVSDGEFYARIKINDQSLGSRNSQGSERLKSDWENEVNVYKKLKSLQEEDEHLPGLPKVKEILQRRKLGELRWEVLTPIMEQPLYAFLRENPNLSSESKKEIHFKIVEAVYTLHTKLNRSHGDIKSDNILINSNLEIVLADFGHSRKRSEKRSFDWVGTRQYAPPEYDSKNLDYIALDSWATGVVLYMVSFGKTPSFYSSEEISSSQFLEKIEGFHANKKPDDFTGVTWEMCQKQPKDRLSVADLYKRMSLK